MPGNRVWISTFHSLGARLLRQYADRLGLDRNFTIYDLSDRSRIVKMALEDAGIDNNRFTPDSIGARHQQGQESAAQPGTLRRARQRLLRPDRRPRLSDLRKAAARRQRPRLRRSAATGRRWPCKHDAELRAELDARFRYVLIDEYQDTNQAQYAIARGLSHRQSEPVRRRATRINRSTNFAARISAISSISSATSPTPAS